MGAGKAVSFTTLLARFGATKSLSLYWVVVTESQKSQWRSATYCTSVKVDEAGTSWISQAGPRENYSDTPAITGRRGFAADSRARPRSTK